MRKTKSPDVSGPEGKLVDFKFRSRRLLFHEENNHCLAGKYWSKCVMQALADDLNVRLWSFKPYRPPIKFYREKV